MKETVFFKVLFLAFLVSCSNNSKKNPMRSGDTRSPVGQAEEEFQLFTILNPIRTGIKFINRLTETADMNGFFYEYYYNGAGLSVADINNDGLQDILFLSNLRENKLYLNLGNLKFKDITLSSGLAGSQGYRTGVTNVDINNDGLMDYYISKSGRYDNPSKRKNELWVNQGLDTDGIPFFKEEAARYHLDIDMCSTQAAFFDYDRDGDLDMFLINHYTAPFNYDQVNELIDKKGVLTGDRMYRNQNGKYVDVTREAGITNTDRLSYALGLSVGDLNNDGWPDIYVANDYEGKDYMYLNNKNGTFTDVANQVTGHTSFYSMGTDIGDINNDGFLDFISLDMMATDNYTMKTSMSAMDTEKFSDVVEKGLHHQYMYNTLQLNNGVLKEQDLPIFSDIAQLAGMAQTDWSWGPLILDMDNDGYNDVFVSNGIKKDFRNNDFMTRQRTRTDKVAPGDREAFIMGVLDEMPARKKRNFFFKNNGDLSFEDKSEKWVIDVPSSSNGAVYADLDNDGDLDLVVNNSDDVSLVYENHAMDLALGNYLKIDLIGQKKNTNAVGSRVAVYTGGKLQIKEVHFTRGFQSAIGNTLHFGLGKNKNIDSLLIFWPDGKTQKLNNVKANQNLTLNYGDADKQGAGREKNGYDKAFFEVISGHDIGVNWQHKENSFNDFGRESLLPHKMSQFGPALAVGDVDGDGLEDFYVGGAQNQASALFVQLPTGGFQSVQTEVFKTHSSYEDVAARFFDADGDGDLDLYVASGGNEHPKGSEYYQDRFFENQNGVFRYRKNALPRLATSSSCILPFDYDEDGDLDLFIGGRQIPGRYPSPASSHLLRNDANGGTIAFTDVTNATFPQLNNMGMVTDALAMDIDGNGQKDMVVTGEWMPVRLFLNTDSSFVEVTEDYGLKGTNGWWNTIKAADFDKDGDLDLVAGNLGLNYKYKATPDRPFKIYGNDFDDNGTFDIVLGYYEDDDLFPLRGRECSSNQMPFIKKKFPSYDAFGKASLEEVYGAGKLENAIKHQAQTFATTYFENHGNTSFSARPLENMAQITSVNAIQVEDFDKDGNLDMVLSGNLYGSEVETPRNDAGVGLLMKGDGNGNFTAVPMHGSGLYIPGEVKHIKNIQVSDQRMLLFARNNDKPGLAKIK